MTSPTAAAAAMRPELLLTVAAMHGIATLAFLRVFRRQLTSPGEGLHWSNPARLAVLVVGGTLALVFRAHTHHAGIRSLRPSARAKRNGTAIPQQTPKNAALGEPTCP